VLIIAAELFKIILPDVLKFVKAFKSNGDMISFAFL